MVSKKELEKKCCDLQGQICGLQTQINELADTQKIYLPVVDEFGNPVECCYYPYGNISKSKYEHKSIADLMRVMLDKLGMEAKIVEKKSNIVIEPKQIKEKEK